MVNSSRIPLRDHRGTDFCSCRRIYHRELQRVLQLCDYGSRQWGLDDNHPACDVREYPCHSFLDNTLIGMTTGLS